MNNLQKYINKEMFYKDLKLTKIWCEENFSLNDISCSLRPTFLKPNIDIRDYNVDAEIKISEVMRLNSIKNSATKYPNNVDHSNGNILLYYPDLSLGDGLVGLESMNFIDSNEMPPWGTWFHYMPKVHEYESVLFSWIPKKAYKIVNCAMLVDQYNCLRWANDQNAQQNND